MTPRPAAWPSVSAGSSACGTTVGFCGVGPDHSSIVLVPFDLLAGFAGRIVDQAGFALDDDRCRRDRVQLAVGALERGFFNMRGAARAQVVGGLETALPRQPVKLVKLFAVW